MLRENYYVERGALLRFWTQRKNSREDDFAFGRLKEVAVLFCRE